MHSCVPVDQEQIFVALVAGLVQLPQLNPHRGSISIEKLQTAAYKHFPWLYELVVVNWRKFIFRHPDVFSVVDPGIGRALRVRLAFQSGWETADEHFYNHRMEWVYGLRSVIMQYAIRRGGRFRLDDMIRDYPRLACTLELPRRGDLVRFIRRDCKGTLAFDPETFMVHLIDY